MTSYHPCTRSSAPANKKSEGHQTQTLDSYFLSAHLFLDDDKINNYSTVCYSRRGMLVVLQATDLETEKGPNVGE